MNTQQEFKDDPIGRYLSSEMAENAPSGFTDKVMSRVSLEARPLKPFSRLKQKNYVPAISIAVILILTCIAFSIPSAGNGPGTMPWAKLLHNIELPSISINLDSLFRYKLPGYLPYLFISILFLSILDWALSGIFHREKNDQAPEV
jgi:hypothetical protein